MGSEDVDGRPAGLMGAIDIAWIWLTRRQCYLTEALPYLSKSPAFSIQFKGEFTYE